MALIVKNYRKILLPQMLPQNRMPTPGYISPSVGMLKTDEKIDHQKQCSNPQSIPGTVVLFWTLCYA